MSNTLRFPRNLLAMVLAFVVAFVAVAGQNENIVGVWEGDLDVGNGIVPMVITITEDDGKLASTVGSFGRGGGFEASEVTFDGTNLKIVVPLVRGGYEGRLEDGSLVGTWTQNDRSLPLNLARRR